MRTRLESAERNRSEIIRGIIDSAKVYKGGGTELFNLGFDEKTKEAVNDALDRLFPRFHEADHKSWRVVIQRARSGSDTPLEVVDWNGPVEDHPVAKEILRQIGSGKAGKSIRRVLSDSGLRVVLVGPRGDGELIDRQCVRGSDTREQHPGQEDAGEPDLGNPQSPNISGVAP